MSDGVDFSSPNRIRVECPGEFNIRLSGEHMEEIQEFKYLGSVLVKMEVWMVRLEKEPYKGGKWLDPLGI